MVCRRQDSVCRYVLLIVSLVVGSCNLASASRTLKQEVIVYNPGQQTAAPRDVQQAVNQALTLVQQMYGPGAMSQAPPQQAGTVVVFPNGLPAQQQYSPQQTLYQQTWGQPQYVVLFYPQQTAQQPLQTSQQPQQISQLPQPVGQQLQPVGQPPRPAGQQPQQIIQKPHQVISNQGSSAAGCPGDAIFDPELHTTLDMHNQFRAKHKVGALCWSSQLQASAQQWADQCVFQHSGPGENLAQYFRRFRDVTQAWYDEVVNYRYDGQFSEATGHFTQMVWKGSTQLGCGYNLSCQLYVCHYSPAGNVLGTFLDNVFPPTL